MSKPTVTAEMLEARCRGCWHRMVPMNCQLLHWHRGFLGLRVVYKQCQAIPTCPIGVPLPGIVGIRFSAFVDDFTAGLAKLGRAVEKPGGHTDG